MADIPTYLQGSQTGGLLQNLQTQQQQQQVPQNIYSPGNGTAPMSSAPNLNRGGMTLDAAMQILNSPSASLESKFAAQQALNQQYNPSPSTGSTPAAASPALNTAASAATAAVGAAAATPAGTATAQPGGWMSPEQLRASSNSLQSNSVGGDTSGGGGGAAGGAPSSSAPGGTNVGLNLSGTQGSAGANNGNPNFTSSNTPVSPTIPYQDPGNVANTPTVGYQGVGGTTGQQGQGVLQMQNADPQAAMSQFQNSLGSQLLGQNSAGQYQQSPGYQYAMDQAMNQVQNRAAATGTLDSGAALKAMQTTASGLAQQDYGNWWNRQNQLYTNYQNGLQGLASGATGSADAMTAGANGAQANLQTGSNLGSLFGNQGTAGTGAIINTGAAQSGNMINAGTQQAQVQSANQATQLAGATLAGNQQAANTAINNQASSGLF